MVTLLLAAAALAITAPALGNAWTDAQFRAAARTASARLSYAHRMSIAKAAPVRVAFDKSANSSRIEIMRPDGRFEPLRTADASDLALPQGVVFTNFSGPGADPAAGLFFATFFPDGTAEARAITIKGKHGESVTLSVHPATGLVSLE